MERRQLGYGFDFEYHYYGPYSDEVATAAHDANARGLISVGKEFTQRGDPYAVYGLEVNGELRAQEDVKNSEGKKRLLHLLSEYSTVVIELAATADFLHANGYPDPWPETMLRKAVKATPERVQSAKQLLSRLDDFSG